MPPRRRGPTPSPFRVALRRDADDVFIRRVGVIKVEEQISFADAFALALAERLHIPLTGAGGRVMTMGEGRWVAA